MGKPDFHKRAQLYLQLSGQLKKRRLENEFDWTVRLLEVFEQGLYGTAAKKMLESALEDVCFANTPSGCYLFGSVGLEIIIGGIELRSVSAKSAVTAWMNKKKKPAREFMPWLEKELEKIAAKAPKK